jgi:predicted metal-dependent phosphoesterase TrpH
MHCLAVGPLRRIGGIGPCPTYHQSQIPYILDADAVEVCNSKHLFGLANGRAKFEASRRRMTMVAGSDSHFAEDRGAGSDGD